MYAICAKFHPFNSDSAWHVHGGRIHTSSESLHPNLNRLRSARCRNHDHTLVHACLLSVPSSRTHRRIAAELTAGHTQANRRCTSLTHCTTCEHPHKADLLDLRPSAHEVCRKVWLTRGVDIILNQSGDIPRRIQNGVPHAQLPLKHAEEPLGALVLGMVEYILGCALLHHNAAIHKEHAVAHGTRE